MTPYGSGTRPPWHLVWTQRVINKTVDEVSLLDLIQHLLVSGTEAGLLVNLHPFRGPYPTRYAPTAQPGNPGRFAHAAPASGCQ